MTTTVFLPEPKSLQKPPPFRLFPVHRGVELVCGSHCRVGPDTSRRLATVPSMGHPWHNSPMQAVLFPEPWKGPSWELFWFNYSS